MADVLERAHALVARYDEEIRQLLPDGAEIFDAHLHLGNDIDGMVGDYDQLLGLMDEQACRARSCSASTSPTGTRPSAPRTTARLRTRLDRRGASSRSSAST